MIFIFPTVLYISDLCSVDWENMAGKCLLNLYDHRTYPREASFAEKGVATLYNFSVIYFFFQCDVFQHGDLKSQKTQKGSINPSPPQTSWPLTLLPP